MFDPATKYYSLNRMLLLACGLWPYQKFTRRIQAAFFLSVLLSFIALQFTTFIDAECTVNLVTKVLSIVLPMLVIVIKHATFFLHSEKMKHLMDLMWYHWTLAQNERELAILEKYSRYTRQFTIFSTHLFFGFVSVVALGHMLPIIQDAVSPLNTSRPRRLYVLVQYPVDQDRYFFPILTHAVLSLSLECIVVLGAGSMILAYILHGSAMLKIAGFSELIFSSFQASYFIMLVSGVASLVFNMFQIFIALVAHDITETITNVLLIGIQFVYLYVGNYAGQIITDHFAEVFDTTYHSSWYTAPVRAQKLLLFVMQRTTKNFSVVFGGIFVVSLKGFSSIASMSISYFTVICSTLYSS